MQYAIASSINYASIGQLLKLLQVLRPPVNLLPKSFYKVQKLFKQFNSKTKIQKVCCVCSCIIEDGLNVCNKSRRDSVPYAALYIAPILIDTRLHSTRGQFFIRHECGACIRLRTNTSLIRMISRSAYGFSTFVITCLHTSDERVQTLYTSCIRMVSNPFSVLHT